MQKPLADRSVLRAGDAAIEGATVGVTDASVAPSAAPSSRWRRWIPILFAGLLVVAVGWLLRREVAAFDYRALRHAIRAIPTERLAIAIALTAGCYIALLGYDALALYHVGRKLPLQRTALASFIAYAFSQSLGVSALTGASIRYRFWSSWGVPAGEIAAGVAFTTLSFWLGVLLIGGAALIVEPLAPHTIPGLPFGVPSWVGVLLLLPVIWYLAWAAGGPGPRFPEKWNVRAPSLRVATAQVLVSTLDWTLAASVLIALLPTMSGVGPMRLIGFFVIAQIAGLVSHVPGGLGVFETVMLVLLRPYAPPAETLAALLAFRGVYYLLPLALATLTFGVHETMRNSGAFGRTVRVFGRVIPAAAPYWLSGVTFLVGVMLLISGSTPSVHARVRWLDSMLPLAVIEVSHFSASLAGMVLLLVANGLRKRLDAAYHMAIVALGVGIVGSLLKGVDYEEAIALTVVLCALVPARRHFYRRSALLAEPLSSDWIGAIALALAGTFALGVFAYKHVDYTSDLWWRFATIADAPRFLRATVGVSAVTLAFAVGRLLRPVMAQHSSLSIEERVRARDVLRRARESNGHLALVGDKSLLFSESGESFLMYREHRGTLVALGDPIGSEREVPELLWAFKEMADKRGRRVAFYQVGRQFLPFYIDLGMTLRKLGEEARVPLTSFTVEGNARRPLRRGLREAEKSGAAMEIVSPQSVDEILPELRRVSDDWLEQKGAREKGFSLGFFDEEYLRECAIAVVRQHGKIVAFANLWLSGEREEISVDLMRYSVDAPRGMMDFLFVSLMLWGREQGYAWFNLGMAPLSGMHGRALAPAWSRVAALVFAHGEHFYNFRGLRQYKDKFDPVWTPRYLATAGALAAPSTILHVTALVSGGARGGGGGALRK